DPFAAHPGSSRQQRSHANRRRNRLAPVRTRQGADMTEMIQFVANYDDLSTDRGYQFRFHCDNCGHGHLSEYEASVMGTAAGLLQAAGTLFGGMLGSAGSSA